MRDRRRKFVELAEARVGKALKQLQLIGNLSNRSAYDYTEADIRKMFLALQRELDSAKSRFSKGAATENTQFKL
jgi:hypothetical protein